MTPDAERRIRVDHYYNRVTGGESWFVYVDGETLRNERGRVKRFRSSKGAEAAAESIRTQHRSKT